MMRRFATVAIISAFLVTPALAQQRKTARQAERQQQQAQKVREQREDKARDQAQRQAKRTDDRQVQKLQRALNLTDPQSEQIRGLLATRAEELAQLKATRKGQKGQKGQRKEDAQDIQERFQTGLRAILSPDQAQLLDSRRNGRKMPIR
jgi:hypothetical protein